MFSNRYGISKISIISRIQSFWKASILQLSLTAAFFSETYTPEHSQLFEQSTV